MFWFTRGMAPRRYSVEVPTPETPVLSAPLTPHFDYTRSTGPVIGAFLTGLRDRRIVGSRGSDSRVHVPPAEFDPVTHTALTETVDVADTGVVTAWAWEPAPHDSHPRRTPFAWALIHLDGADTSLLHILDVDSPDAVTTGMRVRARWATERRGSIHDIEAFIAADAAETPGPARPTVATPAPEPVTMLTTPIGLEITHTASPAEDPYLRGLMEGRLIGRRRADGDEIYIPPRASCPTTGVPGGEYVELTDSGTIVTFAIVNVPFAGQHISPPYVAAYILLDGADIPIQHLVLGCAAADVRTGMRVRAVWRPREEWGPTLANISHFEPLDEPDVDAAEFAHHVWGHPTPTTEEPADA